MLAKTELYLQGHLNGLFWFFVHAIYSGCPGESRSPNPNLFARAVNMSTSQLYKVFTDQTGIPPGEYYNMVKVKHIKEHLENHDLNINMAKVFKEITGFSPSEYRRKFFS